MFINKSIGLAFFNNQQISVKPSFSTPKKLTPKTMTRTILKTTNTTISSTLSVSKVVDSKYHRNPVFECLSCAAKFRLHYSKLRSFLSGSLNKKPKICYPMLQQNVITSVETKRGSKKSTESLKQFTYLSSTHSTARGRNLRNSARKEKPKSREKQKDAELIAKPTKRTRSRMNTPNEDPNQKEHSGFAWICSVERTHARPHLHKSAAGRQTQTRSSCTTATAAACFLRTHCSSMLCEEKRKGRAEQSRRRETRNERNRTMSNRNLTNLSCPFLVHAGHLSVCLSDRRRKDSR